MFAHFRRGAEHGTYGPASQFLADSIHVFDALAMSVPFTVLERAYGDASDTCGVLRRARRWRNL